jgi:hypothetical protein
MTKGASFYLFHEPSKEVYELLHNSSSVECIGKKIENKPLSRIDRLKKFDNYIIDDIGLRKLKISDLLNEL